MSAHQQDEDQSPIRIAVLGGGTGAMASVWGLLQSNNADRYDITIYQTGWRLGGKCASGRNPAYGDRVEEHGLHIWGGMYENAFRMMRQVYRELDRAPEEPLSTWYDADHPERSAFLPHSFLTLAEFEDGRWQPWNLDVPRNSALPGSGTRILPRPRDILEEIVQGMIEMIAGADFLSKMQWLERSLLPRWIWKTADSARRAVLPAAIREAFDKAAHRLSSRVHLLDLGAALDAVQLLPPDPAAHEAVHIQAILEPLAAFEHRFERSFGRLLEEESELRRLFVFLDYGVALVRGILSDRIYQLGFDVIDHEDFASWLGRHGASEITLDSALVRGWYAFSFATPDGQAGPRSLSAAVALRNLIRQVFTFKGAMFWKMQAGMGDVVFAPLYQVLAERPNVHFRFFHRVRSLDTVADGELRAGVQTIEIERQVDLARGRDRYDPLVDVKGLPCWPSEPLFDQLDPEQARRLRDGEVNLESAWADWEAQEVFELKRGRDFDLAILAIPPAASAPMTQALARVHRPWKDMLENLESVQTQAAQLWLDVPPESLGWPHPSTLGTVYANPLNTWANMDQLLACEDWEREGLRPRSLLYLCDTVADESPIPPFSDHDFPARQHRRAREDAEGWLMSNIGPLWPGIAQPGKAELDWSKLTTKNRNLMGQRRFLDQYWRINIDPSERYVLSVPGSSKYRLHAKESGFDNLYLAGDWLRTGLNAGAVEAAVMGGLQASQAISGYPSLIPGDGDFLAGSDGITTPRAGSGPRLELPRDDGVISGPLVQWWYWTGQLQTASGRRFGFEVVFFVVETFGDFVDATMSQAAISDLDGDHFANEQFVLPVRPKEEPAHFELQAGETPIRAEGGDGRDRLRASVGGYELELDVQSMLAPVIHYEGLRHHYDFGGDTYYYSRPFMRGTGSVETPDGGRLAVSGDVWFDRQWGELAPAVLRGWQWFAIQLDDGTAIMLFAFNGAESEWTGSITPKDGPTRILKAGQYQIDILRWWTSGRSGIRYPHHWKLTLPGYDLEIRPEMDNQEMTASFWIGPRYWEGACEVSGSAGGRAYVELVGFQPE